MRPRWPEPPTTDSLASGEHGVLHRDGDIGPRRVAQAAAQTVPVHRADERHAQLVQRQRPIVILFLYVGHVPVVDALLKSFDVNAHAKGFDIRMQDAYPNIILPIDVIAQQQNLLLHRAARRVNGRIVQRHDRNVILHGQKHLF